MCRLTFLQQIFLVYCGIVLSETLGSSTTSSTEQTSPATNLSYTTVDPPVTTTARDLVCYGCSDTQRGGDCQSNSKVMLQEAKDYLAKTPEGQNAQSRQNYVKRCSYDNYTYCVIETIENRGEVHSYIRDCSDGRSFSYGPSKLQQTRPDNQTTCGYTLQGYLICVKLCQSSFCNGPVADISSASPLPCNLFSFLLLALSLMLRN